MPAKLSPPAFNNVLQFKEAAVKGNSRAAAALQADATEGASDPVALTRVSGATHTSQASHPVSVKDELMKDELVKDERAPPPADLAVQIDPKTVCAAVAQVRPLASPIGWCMASARVLHAPGLRGQQ